MKLTKKLLSVVLAAVLLSLGACGTKGNNTGDAGNTATNEAGATAEDTTANTTANTTDTAANNGDDSGKYEVALITDIGTIDDKSFNQGAWEGVEAYAKSNNLTYKYYKPTEKSDDAYLASMDLAVKAGAKIIVCPGYLFEVPVFTAQTKYPDVKFIILDGAPHSGDYNYDIKDNTYSIFYAEEEAGFLAGYAIVKEGYKKLGFMGGMAVPAVIRYGYGFIQGADYAAKELGLAKDDVQIQYTYVGNFDATPDNQAKAAAWYNEGTEVIFACGGAVGNSVMKAAETAGKKVIGVDVDQSSESDTVITSSMKNLSKSVSDALASFYSNKFPGGTTATLNASSEGVQLPMKSSKFEKFTQADYDAIYDKIVKKEITIGNDTVAKDASGVPVENVAVNVVQ
ncbi:BMP family ABC transporter substrate-binding protein [Anaerocolumna sedimenticola]|uniref:BMP family ABC transporter substrate-binding protein n=1 Tax=Anaerocolumna sedimenticola TaxID=2696063 RepID=A0A6P1TK39_9FIRM|nr:BMP family ABC transporter substrate-binding protein [Anaerocolumna sedimenticola]QHQ60657.1 BMP family ABC transporter substrate-binding protein [Anaerocolumna sedimenticola]